MPWNEVVALRRWRDLFGNVRHVQIGMRNGQEAAFFAPLDFHLACHRQHESPPPLQPQDLYSGLNAREKRILLKVADQRPMEEIAADEKISRPRVYQIIRGKDGHGGMIAKNPYAKQLWELRERRQRTATNQGA